MVRSYSTDESIVSQAVKATGNADPKELIALFGTIDYLPDFDHIAERKRQAIAFSKEFDEPLE